MSQSRDTPGQTTPQQITFITRAVPATSLKGIFSSSTLELAVSGDGDTWHVVDGMLNTPLDDYTSFHYDLGPRRGTRRRRDRTRRRRLSTIHSRLVVLCL